MRTFLIKTNNNDIRSFQWNENTSLWKYNPVNDYANKRIEIIYTGKDTTLNEEPFFKIDDFYGLVVDLGFTDAGIEVEITTHINFYESGKGPIAIPCCYSTDWWKYPAVVLFRENGVIENNMPLAMIKTSLKSKTEIEKKEINLLKSDDIMGLYGKISHDFIRGKVQANIPVKRIFQKDYL